MTTPSMAMAMLLTQEPSDDNVLPRTLGQAIVLKLRYALRQEPLPCAALLDLCLDKPSPEKKPDTGNLGMVLKSAGLVPDYRRELDTMKDMLDPKVIEVIKACVSGEGLDLAIRDWPGETRGPATA